MSKNLTAEYSRMVWRNFTCGTTTSRVKSLHTQLPAVLLTIPRLLLPVELLDKNCLFLRTTKIKLLPRIRSSRR